VCVEKECDADLLSEIISTVTQDSRVESTRLEDPRVSACDLIEKWSKKHYFSRRFLYWLPESGIATTKLYKKVVEDTLWDLRMLKAALKRVRQKRFRRVLILRRRFLLFLRKERVAIHNEAIREEFLKRYPQRMVPFLLGLIRWKSRNWQGKVISTFHPAGQDQEICDSNRGGNLTADCSNTNLPTGSLYSFFLALISRNNEDLIQKGAEIVGGPSLMKKARDSISLKERIELFRWVKETLVCGKSLWEHLFAEAEKSYPSNKAEALLLKHVREYCKGKKAVLSILDRMSPAPSRITEKVVLTLRIGGCSLKELNVKSSDVACCYFNGGGYDDNLVKWIISPHHLFFYIQAVKNGEKRYIGVVMLFLADQGETIVIDSVEGKAGTFRQFPGWQEWLVSVLKEYGQLWGVKRIVFNRQVHGDLAKKFVSCVEKNKTAERNPAPVKLADLIKKVPIELDPNNTADFISLLLSKSIKQ